MTDKSLREVIARAIADGWHDPITRWNALADLPPYRRPPWDSEAHIWRPIADAAIAALEASGSCIAPLEPTEAMIEAGDDICPIARGTETHRMTGGRVPEDYYRAMIAARPRDAASTDASPEPSQ